MAETQTITDSETMEARSGMADREVVVFQEEQHGDLLAIALETITPECPKCGTSNH